MNTTALGLFFALGAAVTQPLPPGAQSSETLRFHPQGTFLYVEMPQIPQMLAAYEQAPLIRMVRDGDVQKTVGGLLQRGGVDLRRALGDMAREAGLPESFHADPVAEFLRQARRVRSLSLGVALERPVGEAHEAFQRLCKLHDDLEALEAALERHRRAAQAAPKSVAELDVAPGQRSDPWGSEYRWLGQDQPDLPARLGSLGADGAQGGTGTAQDWTLRDVREELSRQVARSFAIDLHAEFVEAEANAELGAALERLMAGNFGSAGVLQPASNESLGPAQARILYFESRKADHPHATLVRSDAALHLAFHFGTREAGERLVGAGYARSLAEAPRAIDLWQHFEEPKGQVLLRGALDLQAFLEQSGPTHGVDGEVLPRLKFLLDLLQVDRVQLDLRLAGSRFETQTWIERSAGRGGMLDWIGHAPLPASLWPRIPDDAVMVLASSVDARTAYATLKQAIDEESQGKGSEGLAEVEKKYGFSLERDIFGGLGQSASLVLLPLSGLQLPGLILSLEVGDKAAFERGVSGVLKMLQDEVGDAFQIQFKPYRAKDSAGAAVEVPMWIFNFAGQGGGMNPFQPMPAIALVGDQALVTLTSVRAKREIKRILGEGENPLHRLLSGPTPPPKTATTYSFQDWGALLGSAWATGRSFLGMAPAGSIPFQASELPDFALFAKFFEPSVSWTTRGEKDVLVRSFSSFGPESAGMLLGGIGIIGWRRHSAASAVATQTVEVVEVAPAVPDAQEIEAAKLAAGIDETRGTLQRIAGRLAVYRLDQGKLPETLAMLTAPTPNYPQGFLDGKPLPSDAWGRSLCYQVKADGSFELWSLGPDGVDQAGAGDDVRPKP